MEQIYTPTRDYKVLVRCMTYNQSKYIEDALNGFAMQSTDFPFVCLVMDDCSTDGEQEVIKAWMERECDMEKVENLEIEKSFVTIVPHRTNVNCTFAFYFLKENLYKKGVKIPMITPWREHCEYEALCEGDDYWIDNNKLQKQVDYLDAHNDCCIVSSNFIEVDKDNRTIGNITWDKSSYTFEDMLVKNRIGTLSAMIRLSVSGKYIPPYPNLSLGDYPYWLFMIQQGTHYCIQENLAAYRKLDNSASHSTDKGRRLKFLIDVIKVKDYYAESSNKTEVIASTIKHDINNILASSFALNLQGVINADFMHYYKKYSCRTVRNSIVLMAFRNRLLYKLLFWVYSKR